MSDTSLYNKYRPTDFKQVMGQDIVVSILSNQLKKNKLPHSMIFHGDFGTGKTSVARIVANKLNNTGFGLIEQDCTIEFLLDDARKLQNTVDQFPMDGTNKVYIFDEAHNIPQKAFDGLLKTVEEPPKHVYFIFVTSNFQKIPKGIVSRSTDYEFKLINNTTMSHLIYSISEVEDIPITDYIVDAIIQKSKGSARNALVCLNKIAQSDSESLSEDEISNILGVVDIKYFQEFVKCSIFKDFSGLMTAIDKMNNNNLEIENTISLLQKYIIELRFNLLDSKRPDGNTAALAFFLKKQNLDLKNTGRYLDYLYDLVVVTYKDIINLPFPEHRLKRLVIEIVKTWQ